MTPRQCGDCQLCCKLVPVSDLQKPANTRCKHQRHAKGCLIYDRRPFSCMAWSCSWLGSPEAALRRPDRSHYVIDPVLDYVTASTDQVGMEEVNMPAVQVWVDPDHREAADDPALFAYLEAKFPEGIVALIRFSSDEGYALLSPAMTGRSDWFRPPNQESAGREHTAVEVAAVVGVENLMR